MTVPILAKGRTPTPPILVTVALACVLACGSGADRHLERAETLMLENRTREALISLHAAARLRPEDVDLTLRVARISAELGYYGDAAAFYRDALTLRPDDLGISISLIRLLARIDPQASKERLSELVEKNSDNVRTWLLRAELALLENDTDAALGYVYQARRIAPQEAEVDWTLAITNEAIGRNARNKNPLSIPSPRHWRDTVAAYDRYLAMNGARQVPASMRRAAALTRIPGRENQALRAHEDLLDQLQTSNDPAQSIEVATQVYDFGRRIQDTQLAQRAIDSWLEVAPSHPKPWHKQAALYDELATEERDAAYRRMLERSGSEVAVQIVYAEHLAKTHGPGMGTKHLANQVAEDPDSDTLLAALIDLQQRSGRLRDATNSLRKFQERFPGDPQLKILKARQALLSGNHGGAESIITTIPQEQRNHLAHQILAQSQMKQNQNDKAIETIERAIAMADDVDPASLRLKAQIQFNRRKHREAAAALIQLQRITPLTPTEQIRLAGAYYDSLAPGIGRKILTQMLESETANSVVALEFFRREKSNPKQQANLERILETARKRDLANMEILRAISDLDVANGKPERALRRVDAIIDQAHWHGGPYLVRARIHLSQGRFKLAIDDAERARRLTSAITEEALEVQALAYLASPDPSRPISNMEKQARAGNLSADQLALLARLHLHSGNSPRALELYEEALASGTTLHHVRNDLALLLAESETDLERAEALAKAAVAASGKQINAIDTLGYVYLKQGQAPAAYWQFRYAIANSDTPVPDYHYHLALALVAMDRNPEAQEALKQALAVDPNFEPARQLSASLDAEDAQAAHPAAAETS